MGAAISRQQLNDVLTAYPAWSLDEGELNLCREIQFHDFSEAFDFMKRVADYAEQVDHHPDWSNCYSIVRIRLHSHDVGAITQRDIDFVVMVENLLRAP